MKPTIQNTDSIILHLLKFNEKNPIQYNGLWYPIGTLKKFLETGKPKSHKEDS